MKKTVFCVVFIGLALCVFGQTFTHTIRSRWEEGATESEIDLECKRENGGITITGCVGRIRQHLPVAIPEKIDGLPVTAIGDRAFQDRWITGVTIPNTVTTIGDYAFDNNRIKNVIIPNSVITIGQYAFFQNPLTSVTIGNSVTTIGDEAFYGNDLTSVTIPRSVKTIGTKAFYYNHVTSVTIPRSVKAIGDEAFDGDVQIIRE